MRIRQGAWGVAAVAVIGLAVAGCTGPTHGALPSASRSTAQASAAPTISPSPTSTAPVEPTPTPEMAQPSADGAAATARYFIELYMYALATGDLETWRAMSADDCKMCNKVIAQVEDLAAQQHTVSTQSLEFPASSGMETVPLQSYGADLTVEQGAWTEHDASGAAVSSGPPVAVQMFFALAWQGDTWLVRQVDVHEAAPAS